jgi:hypothetical protein
MLFSVTNAFSQATSETPLTAAPSNSSTDISFWERVKKAPIGLSVTNEVVANTEAVSVTGITNATDMTFKYKITPKNNIRLTSGLSLVDTNKTTTDATYNGSTLSFHRSSILTQDKYGVDMNASVRYNAFPGGDVMTGSTSLRSDFSRTVSPIFSASSGLRWDEYVRNTSDPTVSRRKFQLWVSPTFSLNEKLSVSPSIVFNESIKGSGVKDTNNVNFSPSLDYTFSPNLSTSLYWDTYPMKSGDDTFFSSRWYSTGGLGFVLSYAIL